MKSEAQYFLPFDTVNPTRISQGRNGPWSHSLQRTEITPGNFRETDLLNAVDFALPLKSQVLAARDGIIFNYWLNSTWYYEELDPEIGNNPPPGSTNYLIIEHTDGTFGLYSHLSSEPLVSRGQRVRQGDVIALTGKSGWIAHIPHLHFQVMDCDFTKSLPVKIKNYNGSLNHDDLVRNNSIYFG